MATRFVGGPNNAEFPDANFPQLMSIHSTDRIPVLAFDAATDERCMWTTEVPAGQTGTITAKIKYCMASATSGAVRFQVSCMAVTPGDAVDLDTSTSYDTANSNGGTVPGTAGHETEITVTISTLDSQAAGDRIRWSLNRDADGTSGTDDAAGDCYVTLFTIMDAA
jgi:hypothetical protein